MGFESGVDKDKTEAEAEAEKDSNSLEMNTDKHQKVRIHRRRKHFTSVCVQHSRVQSAERRAAAEGHGNVTEERLLPARNLWCPPTLLLFFFFSRTRTF